MKKFKPGDRVRINDDGLKFYHNEGDILYNAVFNVKEIIYGADIVYETFFLHYSDGIDRGIDYGEHYIKDKYLDYDKKYLRKEKMKRLI